MSAINHWALRKINKFFANEWMPSYLEHFYRGLKADGLEFDEDALETVFEELKGKYRELLEGRGR